MAGEEEKGKRRRAEEGCTDGMSCLNRNNSHSPLGQVEQAHCGSRANTRVKKRQLGLRGDGTEMKTVTLREDD